MKLDSPAERLAQSTCTTTPIAGDAASEVVHRRSPRDQLGEYVISLDANAITVRAPAHTLRQFPVTRARVPAKIDDRVRSTTVWSTPWLPACRTRDGLARLPVPVPYRTSDNCPARRAQSPGASGRCSGSRSRSRQQRAPRITRRDDRAQAPGANGARLESCLAPRRMA